MRIDEIDKNLQVQTTSGKNDVIFIDSLNNCFDLYGVFYKDGQFRRMEDDEASKVSDGVKELAKCTSGGRIRFITDSPYIAIRCVQPKMGCGKMNSLSNGGLDMNVKYDDQDIVLTFQPPYAYAGGGYEALQDFGSKKEREITINFPMYHELNKLEIGISKDAEIKKGREYVNDKPVVFYGSSITQGCCACRPSNAYVNMLSNKLNMDIINLGFSGSCKAETLMAEYISNLKMKCFVFDYDHNAPNVEYLENTHYPFYQKIREKNKDLPIIFVSKPDYYGRQLDIKKRDLIIKNYEKAKASGDKNIYFVDGKEIFEGYEREACTIDRIHPNDLGMYLIYKKMSKVLEKILGGKNND